MESSFFLRASFATLPIILILAASCMVRSKMLTAGLVFVLVVTGLLAHYGVLADFKVVPPRLLVWLIIPLTVATFWLAFNSMGTRFRDLPLSWLIGFQAFRFPLELMIHQAVEEGIAPPQFTWTGLNWDILSGLLALVLAPIAARVPKWTIWGWNIIGLCLLLNIVTVAMLSVPGPMQLLTPPNTWVAYFPFVWLPAICVMSALFFHLVLTRKLLASETSAERSLVQE